MLRWQAILGITLGLLAALLVSRLLVPRSAPAEVPGPMLPDHGGPIGSVVIQYAADASFVLPTYKEFFAQLDSAVQVYLMCPDEPAREAWVAGVGPLRQPLRTILTHHAMTAWSRDRWVALEPGRRGGPITLLCPRGEDAQQVWPQRAGDARLAADLSEALKPRVLSQRSLLLFDGGDLLADGQVVFYTPAVVSRNLHLTVSSDNDIQNALSAALRRRPVLLAGAPDHHAGMYMMAAGDKQMVVADPSLGQPLAADIDPALLAKLPGGPDFSPEIQAQFDAVAKLVAAEGYAVTRIPVIPAKEARVYLTFVNVILDRRSDATLVFMPTYRNADRLNAAAARVWESLGYQVRPVDCTGVFDKGGTLHCLVNVMERE